MTRQEVLKEYKTKLGFPESSTMDRIFDILFDGENDAEVIGAMPGTVPEIAEKTGLDEGEVKSIVERLFKRGAAAHPMNRPDVWKLFPVMIELRDASVITPDLPQELVELWETIIFIETKPLVELMKGANLPSGLRVVPIEEAVESKDVVLDIDSARKLIRDAEVISAQPCACRTHARLMGRGQDCPAPPEAVCMQTNGFARSVLARGIGKQITTEEALRRLDAVEKAGLIHMTRNSTAKDAFLCNCCGCCCGGFHFLKNFKFAGVFAPSRFRVRHDEELCAQCGTCVKRCQFGAISMADDGTVKTDPSLCYGCGNCVYTCPSGARVLEEIRPREFVPAARAK
jgi:ferredoxin